VAFFCLCLPPCNKLIRNQLKIEKTREAVKLTKIVPFLLEDKLKELGANYTSKGNWEAYTQQDGLLITGQNPASSDGVAKLLLKTLKNEKPVHS